MYYLSDINKLNISQRLILNYPQHGKMMCYHIKLMNNKIIWLVIIIIIGAGGWYYYSKQQLPENTGGTTAIQNTPSTITEVTPVATTTAVNQTIKEFTVDGTNYAFAPASITVNKGDQVKINFKDDDGFHDLRIDGYNVGTTRVNTGGLSSVTFTADKAGSFEYYCSVGSHRAKGMKGTLVVQ